MEYAAEPVNSTMLKGIIHRLGYCVTVLGFCIVEFERKGPYINQIYKQLPFIYIII
jgi:hypothetical protein